VVAETLLALPRWVYLGVFVGGLLSAGVAVTFLVASRLFPDGNRTRDTRRSTEERRRTEIRQYLEAIGERFTEDELLEGEPVAFYLPAREVAVTFRPRSFYALERSGIHPILVEHEMPGVALGNRLPFETPDVAFGRRRGPSASAPAARERDRAEAAYTVLGLPSGADEAAVRRAYRERVKEVHPDHGGDHEEFRRLTEAYDTVKRRAD
jgi:hypothetical protein